MRCSDSDAGLHPLHPLPRPHRSTWPGFAPPGLGTVELGTVDLANCDREPIHLPGTIQPHGILLAFDATGRLTHASRNAASVLPRLASLGGMPGAVSLSNGAAPHRPHKLQRGWSPTPAPTWPSIPKVGVPAPVPDSVLQRARGPDQMLEMTP